MYFSWTSSRIENHADDEKVENSKISVQKRQESHLLNGRVENA